MELAADGGAEQRAWPGQKKKEISLGQDSTAKKHAGKGKARGCGMGHTCLEASAAEGEAGGPGTCPSLGENRASQ